MKKILILVNFCILLIFVSSCGYVSNDNHVQQDKSSYNQTIKNQSSHQKNSQKSNSEVYSPKINYKKLAGNWFNYSNKYVIIFRQVGDPKYDQILFGKMPEGAVFEKDVVIKGNQLIMKKSDLFGEGLSKLGKVNETMTFSKNMKKFTLTQNGSNSALSNILGVYEKVTDKQYKYLSEKYYNEVSGTTDTGKNPLPINYREFYNFYNNYTEYYKSKHNVPISSTPTSSGDISPDIKKLGHGNIQFSVEIDPSTNRIKTIKLVLLNKEGKYQSIVDNPDYLWFLSTGVTVANDLGGFTKSNGPVPNVKDPVEVISHTVSPNTHSQIYSSEANAVMDIEVDNNGNDTITFYGK